ncbi:MAG: recombination-associated protein RdgC [Desulfobacterales bacterium]|nr:recombination-associated protein RdgC [Desulfobacterales bacterium]MDD4071246.1 recombination-associated protein RdgC [Desulfobacterales bacterium]MDD4393270.1 recombination-associated protein RdgC [Desulfobacterales bacterium]
MGLLSSTVSLTRYKVEGNLKQPVLDTIADGLKKYVIRDIDDDVPDRAVGWTSFENSFHPDFEGSSFSIGELLVFSLRIDKKSIPAKVIQKHFKIASAKRLADSGREYLSQNEKKMLKEEVINRLNLRIPSTPNIYDLMWDYENAVVWFFSTQKAANEELETLFSKSFGVRLIRLFPYTCAELTAGLSDSQNDCLEKLSPTLFME